MLTHRFPHVFTGAVSDTTTLVAFHRHREIRVHPFNRIMRTMDRLLHTSEGASLWARCEHSGGSLDSAPAASPTVRLPPPGGGTETLGHIGEDC